MSDNTVIIEDCRLIFRNFEGKEGQYNRKGDRNFAIILDPATAERMSADGWNIKELRPQEEGDVPTPYLPVAVNFTNRPPRIVMITSGGRSYLSEDNVEILDWMDIERVDLTLNPYSWTVQDKSGVKAYLKTMYVTIEEDALDRKYAQIPERAQAQEPQHEE